MMAVKTVKRTAQNSKLPPLKYDLIDKTEVGNNKYERRNVFGVDCIYVYSDNLKQWSSYARTEVEERWRILTDESNH